LKSDVKLFLQGIHGLLWTVALAGEAEEPVELEAVPVRLRLREESADCGIPQRIALATKPQFFDPCSKDI